MADASCYIAIDEHTTCRRCTQPFVYGRVTKPRVYCDPCVILERQDANVFANSIARERRRAARRGESL